MSEAARTNLPPGQAPAVNPFTLFSDQLRSISARRAAEQLSDQPYQHQKVQNWIQIINEAILADARVLSGEYKFMVSTVIVQKVGAGMVTSASCYWDATTDGCLSSTFETAQMTCIMTVFACAV